MYGSQVRVSVWLGRVNTFTLHFITQTIRKLHYSYMFAIVFAPQVRVSVWLGQVELEIQRQQEVVTAPARFARFMVRSACCVPPYVVGSAGWHSLCA